MNQPGLRRRAFLALASGFGGSAMAALLAPGRGGAADGPADACVPSSALSRGIGQETPLPATADVRLQPGEMLVVQGVNPRCFYYPTQLVVQPGAVYAFDSVGFWKDGALPSCGPEGWPGLLLQLANRLPGRQFFLLCGSVGQTDRTAFAIGRRKRWRAPGLAPGGDDRLYLFANDWPQRIFQDNNRALDPAQGGPLRVTISRVS